MNRILRAAFGVFGAVLGGLLVYILINMKVIPNTGNLATIAFCLLGAGLTFLLFMAIARPVFSETRRLVETLSEQLRRMPLSEIILSTLGLLVGLLIASIVSHPLLQLSVQGMGNVIGVLLSVVIYVILGLLGMRLASLFHDEILAAFRQIQGTFRNSEERKKTPDKEKKKSETQRLEVISAAQAKPKVFDTSVIIDARIFEVLRTGFLEGPIVISHYVLEELQHISDSSDPLRRERGRRGLDAIQKLQHQKNLKIQIDNQNIDSTKAVDTKLLVLTQSLGGALVTTDYNLNKVAQVQSIPVLNVNELVNALKTIVIPGEHLMVDVIKPGKEFGQGLGYLDDGTMIVVENGYSAIGTTVDTVVTSVLQTAAGKMIFSRIQEMPDMD